MVAKDLLKSRVIAATGDFGPQRTHDKIKLWVQHNGGVYAPEMSSRVTHLVCSRDHWNNKVTMVTKAELIRTVKIVCFDWLEDSLMSRNKKAKPEKEYLMSNVTRARDIQKTGRKVIREKNIKKSLKGFKKGCKEFEQDMHDNGYHLYQDYTGFCYDITLARADLAANKNERYNLKLYESHASPKLYACYTKFSAPKKPAAPDLLAPIGSSWELAYDVYKKFFLLKTLKEWDMRLVKGNMGPEAFIYSQPKPGELHGVLHNGVSNGLSNGHVEQAWESKVADGNTVEDKTDNLSAEATQPLTT